jgi:hypothetical protein
MSGPRLQLWLAVLIALLAGCSLTPIQIPGLEGGTPVNDRSALPAADAGTNREAGSSRDSVSPSPADRSDTGRDGLRDRPSSGERAGDGMKPDGKKVDGVKLDGVKKG